MAASGSRRGQAVLALAAVLVLAGCAVPRGAPTQPEVLRSAAAETAGVQVVAVDRAALGQLRDWPQPAGLGRTDWPGAAEQPAVRLIRAGDEVQITVWDSARDSLIVTETQRVVPMQAMTVSAAGRVFIPYVGEVQVAGLPPDAARAEVERRFREAVPDGQVQLAIAPGPANSVDVVTGVARPGRVPLPVTSPTILSVLSQAGGIAPGLRNPLVRLNRGGRAYAIPARRLFAEPQRDIVLRGGDRLMVEEDARSFAVLGASGRQEVVPFDRDEIHALDALSRAGGLNPGRANLQGLMVLRQYPERALRPTGAGPRLPWVVFTFDLSTAEGLFAARNFRIAPGDVVLATESPVPVLTQLIGLIRGVRTLD